MTNCFEKIATLVHNDRVSEQEQKNNQLLTIAKREYSKFSMWCRMQNIEPTVTNFKIYQETENVVISFWIKKKIMEYYYNYVFEFNYVEKKWYIKKGAK